MRGYRYTCASCGQDGTVSTTDRPPEPDGLCEGCWRKKVAEVCREIMAAQRPHPVRLEFLLEMCVKTHGLHLVPPLRMLWLDERMLRRILREHDVAVVEVMARLSDAALVAEEGG